MPGSEHQVLVSEHQNSPFEALTFYDVHFSGIDWNDVGDGGMTCAHAILFGKGKTAFREIIEEKLQPSEDDEFQLIFTEGKHQIFQMILKAFSCYFRWIP